MITTTLGKLAAADIALADLNKMDLPVAASIRVARLIRVVIPEMTIFYEKRNALIVKFGVARSLTQEEVAAGVTGEVISVRDHRGYQSAFDELCSVESYLHVDAVALSVLGDVRIAPVNLLPLLDAGVVIDG